MGAHVPMVTIVPTSFALLYCGYKNENYTICLDDLWFETTGHLSYVHNNVETFCHCDMQNV